MFTPTNLHIYRVLSKNITTFVPMIWLKGRFRQDILVK